jgi:hypothetical protein
MTPRRVLLYALAIILAIIAFICSLPSLMLGIFDFSWSIASLFYEPFTSGHQTVSFFVGFGTVFTLSHGVPYLWIWWWGRRKQRRAQTRNYQRANTRHPGASVPSVPRTT